MKDWIFGLRILVVLLSNLANFATEIHFGREIAKHANASNDEPRLRSVGNEFDERANTCPLFLYRTAHPDLPNLKIDSVYQQLVDTLVDFELFMCRVLKFQLTPRHPHQVSGQKE